MISTEQNQDTIESVNELVTALSEGERTNFTDIIGSLKLSSSSLKCFSSWSSTSYTRNCIIDTEDFELILLCWEKGQITPIHDHGGEECWVKVIEGEFQETIYKMDDSGTLNTIKSTVSKAGDISYMIDFMGCHSLENISNKRSMSLHLYAKPIRNCQCFDEKSKTFVRKDLEYCTVSELMMNTK
ncbi:MAG: cysteine dioxygenase [Salibacteraceae bacterium]